MRREQVERCLSATMTIKDWKRWRPSWNAPRGFPPQPGKPRESARQQVVYLTLISTILLICYNVVIC